VSNVRLYPRATLAILTALNLLNYIDRSVLYGVQSLVQDEFHRSNEEFGLLTTAFFLCYMVAAPIIGPLADRYSRKAIIIAGAMAWSAATLLTAVAHDFTTLLFRHTIVGIGEVSFATIAPTLVADLFPEEKRGRILGIFYLTIPVGTALGYLIGGHLAAEHGWRYPFLVVAAPGFLLALVMFVVPEPPRGLHDSIRETADRGTYRSLLHNRALWTATLGMAAMTFALGGLQVWMPTFLIRERSYSLERANQLFGLVVVFDGTVASLAGGWLGDRLLPRLRSSYYVVSAVSMLLGVPVMCVAFRATGTTMVGAIFIAAFLVLFNTAPLNAAVLNSVGAHVRNTAIAANIFVIHLLGDAFSPWLIGRLADQWSLGHAMLATAPVALALSSAILFYGTKFAPPISPQHQITTAG
jgi:MFS family permease